METELLTEVKKILSTFPEYWEAENLLKSKVIEDIREYRTDLFDALLSNVKIKDAYAIPTSHGLIFKSDEFVSMLRYKNYWENSYTKFSNEIGLTSEGKYLKYDSDVVLDFPHKDCVLEGGMTKEDRTRHEIYYHQVLAREEIDVLLSPKVLTNVKKYSNEGIEEITEYHEKDNLLIKGNNLVALHSLKERFAGKVKAIYIDPPYNTGGDSFKYNDKFSRSTWLVFMKNRLEVAWELLHSNGCLAVQCSFHQYAYLKVMLDNLFGADREVVTFNCLVRHPDRSITADKDFNDVVEYVLVYSKSSGFKLPKRIKEKTSDDYVYEVVFDGEPDEILVLDEKKVEVYGPSKYKVEKRDPSEELLKTISIRGSIKEKNSSGRFYVKHLEGLKNRYESLTLFKVPNMGDDSFGYRLFHLPKDGNKNGTYFQGLPKSSDITEIPHPNFLNYVGEYNVVNHEGEIEFRNGKKPEALIRFLMEILTEEHDLILDFFMGSATTQAVAMKMNRQFIGIEQMDYIQSVSVPRLMKVMEGEQGGISEDVDWQGGGSFVYAELQELNITYVHLIQEADTEEELYRVMEGMKESAYLNFKVNVEKVTNESSGFALLTLDEKKQLLIEVLDGNQLYLSYSEMDDAKFEVPGSIKAFNRSFYEEGVKR